MIATAMPMPVPAMMPAFGYLPSSVAFNPHSQSHSSHRIKGHAAQGSAGLLLAPAVSGRLLADLCVVELIALFPPASAAGERPHTLRYFVQAVLDASATSTDVVFLALYYLRQTMTADSASQCAPRVQSIVLDSDGARVDGSVTDADLAYTTPFRVREHFIAALTCAHKFETDAAYTTRTWADLGGLNTAKLVQAERELLARLDFALIVPQKTLNHFRGELYQQLMTAANAGGYASFNASPGYEKSAASMMPTACHYHQHQRYSSLSAYAYSSHAPANTNNVFCRCSACAGSSASSPSGTDGPIWPSTHSVGLYSYDASWPCTPTSITSLGTEDYFSAPHYAPYAPFPVQINGPGSFYSMPQPYCPPEALAASFAAPTTIVAMPEPSMMWPMADNTARSSPTASGAHATTLSDAVLGACNSAPSMLPQMLPFYAY